MNSMLRLQLVICWCGFSSVAFAQWSDAGMNLYLQADHKWNDSLKSTFSIGNRINDNYNHLWLSYAHANIQYKINKHFTTALNYRFGVRNPMEEADIRHRIFLDVAYRRKFKKFIFSPRTRMQMQFSENYFSDNSERISWIWRNRLTLSYSRKKFNPYLSVELFHALNDVKYNGFSRYRATVGCEYELTKDTSVDVYFRKDTQVNVPNPLTMYLSGITYNFKF